MRVVLAALMAMMLAAVAFGQDEETIPLAEVEARTAAISKTLRCVVCQNQSIHDSNAPLAADMRTLVEKRVLAGDSDDDVRVYLRERYGDYVLMSPPFQANTLLLWLGPAILIGLCGLWFVLRLRAGKAGIAEDIAMSDVDRERVRAALSGPDDEAAS